MEWHENGQEAPAPIALPRVGLALGAPASSRLVGEAKRVEASTLVHGFLPSFPGSETRVGVGLEEVQDVPEPRRHGVADEG
ncbi:MAG: hypothetical protein GY854_21460 [Deltaproteobacteria bacterium]|nr:hypothetical protein [Deltaproteobacteria bacterium]